MTAEQKIKREVLLSALKQYPDYDWIPNEITIMNVDELYFELGEVDYNTRQEIKSELREGQVETGLDCDSSRNYESKAVGMQCCDGSWVGWTYWYGGGKYGDPNAIEWMNGAYDIEMSIECKMVAIMTFSKKKD